MEWGALARDIFIPLISALVGGFGAYYRVRRTITAPFREHLYARQVDAFIELVGKSERLKWVRS
jgi:hypothetical protein